MVGVPQADRGGPPASVEDPQPNEKASIPPEAVKRQTSARQPPSWTLVRPAATVVFVRRRALRRLLWAPADLGLVRPYGSGGMRIGGDIFPLLDLPEVIDRVAHHQLIGLSLRQRLAAAVTAARIGAVGLPPRPPAEEIRRRRGRLHSISRDAQSVRTITTSVMGSTG